MPEDGYGWEKLFSERMCRHFREDFGIADARGALSQRLRSPRHLGGGREKAPAAICRKVIEAQLSGRARDRDLGRRRADAQLHVHRRLPERHPDDHGTATSTSRSISAATSWSRSISWSTSSRRSPASSSKRRYKLDAPKGVRGRNSDNTLIKQKLGWAPSIPLRDGHGEDLSLDPRRDAEALRRAAQGISLRLRRGPAPGRYAGASAPSTCSGRCPSRNQIVIVKRLSPNASVSQCTGHTSWNASLGKNTMLLSTGARLVYVPAPVLPEGVTQVS